VVKTTLKGEQTRADILKTGLDLWRHDAAQVTTRQIAERLGITHAGVLYHFKSIDALKLAVARHAVHSGDASVIRQLIVTDHPAVAAMDRTTRHTWLNL